MTQPAGRGTPPALSLGVSPHDDDDAKVPAVPETVTPEVLDLDPNELSQMTPSALGLRLRDLHQQREMLYAASLDIVFAVAAVLAEARHRFDDLDFGRWLKRERITFKKDVRAALLNLDLYREHAKPLLLAADTQSRSYERMWTHIVRPALIERGLYTPTLRSGQKGQTQRALPAAPPPAVPAEVIESPEDGRREVIESHDDRMTAWRQKTDRAITGWEQEVEMTGECKVIADHLAKAVERLRKRAKRMPRY